MVAMFRYFGVGLFGGCTACYRTFRQVYARILKATAALKQVQSYCNHQGIIAASTRMQLMHSFVCCHMTFACAVWGHAFGTKLQLRATAAGGCTRLSILFMLALHWAIRAPSFMHLNVSFLICNTLLLHGIIVKQIVWYFHRLERSLKHASPSSAMVTVNCT